MEEEEEEEEEEEGAPARPARRRPRPEVAGGGGGDRTQPRNEVTAAISEDEFSELVATIDRETSKGKEEWKGRGACWRLLPLVAFLPSFCTAH